MQIYAIVYQGICHGQHRDVGHRAQVHEVAKGVGQPLNQNHLQQPLGDPQREIEGQVDGEAAHPSFVELHRLIVCEVIEERERDCFASLGCVHSRRWNPGCTFAQLP